MHDNVHAVLVDLKQVIAKTLSLGKLFELNLSIPDYQRTYCWRKEQVLDLLETIRKAFESRKKYLHIGTIVIHKDNNGSHDIVDGQQRLITLTILIKLLNVSEITLPLINSKIKDAEARKHIFWASNTITTWLNNSNITDYESFKYSITTMIQICVVIIPKENPIGLAYTFFNAINSSGLKLSDYELLKAHHLRYINNDTSSQHAAARWDDWSQEKKGKRQSDMLNLCLFRLRHWSRARQIDGSTHHMLRQFSASCPISVPTLCGGSFKYNETIVGGEYFFAFIEKYKELYKSFAATDSFVILNEIDSEHLRLVNVFRAILFLYYYKFGSLYLNDALFFIMERVSIVRNEYQVKDKIVSHLIVFETTIALDEASSPEYFFQYCWSPENRYDKISVKGIKFRYWNQASKAYIKLREDGLRYYEKCEEVLRSSNLIKFLTDQEKIILHAKTNN